MNKIYYETPFYASLHGLRTALLAGEKINAIKHLRGLPKDGLKEAKDMIETIMEIIQKPARPNHPDSTLAYPYAVEVEEGFNAWKHWETNLSYEDALKSAKSAQLHYPNDRVRVVYVIIESKQVTTYSI